MEGNAEQDTSLNIDSFDYDDNTVQINNNNLIIEYIQHDTELLWDSRKDPPSIF